VDVHFNPKKKVYLLRWYTLIWSIHFSWSKVLMLLCVILTMG